MRSRHCIVKICLLLTLALPAATSRAVVVWDSSSNGPLSASGSAPTPFTLFAGTNSIISTVGGSNHQNWVVMTVPSGFELDRLVLANFQSTDRQGFTGVQRGTSFVGSIDNPASYLGYTHFGTGATNGSLPATNLVGTDVLPLMGDNGFNGTAPGSQGFTPPLPSGSYVFLIQQGGATTTYQYDFDVTRIPEPGGLPLLGAAGALLFRLPRKYALSRR
ncbi:MAG: hypothetical protein JWO87_420 [Phycisphaerales bacterium]|jgi:hypothetical protein|nr:hypothetical protein [Phycisphaerales bacterium]